MNENIDLTKILEGCPIDFKLYSPMCGIVLFRRIDEDAYAAYPIKGEGPNGNLVSFTQEGRCFENCPGAECLLFPSKDQRDWSKFSAPWYQNDESIKPKFKVGDIIRHKETNKDDVYKISKVYDDSYGIVGFAWMIYMKYQDQYELVSNKFDPKTLKPFDRVITRNDYDVWTCTLFSHISNKPDSRYIYVTCESVHKYCIPYNDETKHLVGTKDEAHEFYKYWED